MTKLYNDAISDALAIVKTYEQYNYLGIVDTITKDIYSKIEALILPPKIEDNQ